MRRFPIKILVILIISTWAHTTLQAQFHVDKIELTSLFGSDEASFRYYPDIRYNRVEGLFLGAGIEYTSETLSDITFLSNAGYGLSNSEWRYKAGLYRDFFDFSTFRIGAEGFHTTATNDDWLIRSIENSLAGAFFNEDFMNYFSKKGFKAYASKIFADNQLQLRFEVANYDYESMKRTTHLSVFLEDHKFHENPVITQGNETSTKFIFSYDRRDNPIFPLSGWMLDGVYENTSGKLETDGLFLTLKNYFSTFGAQRIRTRTMLGTRAGDVAEQHAMDLGGLGTLPGFKDKEFVNGDRFFLFSFNYLFGGDILQKIPLSFIPLYEAVTFGLFFDSGWLHFENDEFDSFKGFDKMSIDDMHTDVGFTFSISEDMLHIKAARRTDKSDDAWRILLRLLYKF